MSERHGTKNTPIKQIPIPVNSALLSCGHASVYKGAPPVVDDYVYCRGCDGWRFVRQVTRVEVAKT